MPFFLRIQNTNQTERFRETRTFENGRQILTTQIREENCTVDASTIIIKPIDPATIPRIWSSWNQSVCACRDQIFSGQLDESDQPFLFACNLTRFTLNDNLPNNLVEYDSVVSKTWSCEDSVLSSLIRNLSFWKDQILLTATKIFSLNLKTPKVYNNPLKAAETPAHILEAVAKCSNETIHGIQLHGVTVGSYSKIPCFAPEDENFSESNFLAKTTKCRDRDDKICPYDPELYDPHHPYALIYCRSNQLFGRIDYNHCNSLLKEIKTNSTNEMTLRQLAWKSDDIQMQFSGELEFLYQVLSDTDLVWYRKHEALIPEDGSVARRRRKRQSENKLIEGFIEFDSVKHVFSILSMALSPSQSNAWDKLLENKTSLLKGFFGVTLYQLEQAQKLSEYENDVDKQKIYQLPSGDSKQNTTQNEAQNEADSNVFLQGQTWKQNGYELIYQNLKYEKQDFFGRPFTYSTLSLSNDVYLRYKVEKSDFVDANYKSVNDINVYSSILTYKHAKEFLNNVTDDKQKLNTEIISPIVFYYLSGNPNLANNKNITTVFPSKLFTNYTNKVIQDVRCGNLESIAVDQSEFASGSATSSSSSTASSTSSTPKNSEMTEGFLEISKFTSDLYQKQTTLITYSNCKILGQADIHMGITCECLGKNLGVVITSQVYDKIVESWIYSWYITLIFASVSACIFIKIFILRASFEDCS